MRAMDIRITDTIVCYDFLGMLAAPRVSWMLRAYGAQNVFVLDGTPKNWEKENIPICSGQDVDSISPFMRERITQPQEDDYDFKLNSGYVENYKSIRGAPLILDNRKPKLY